jgi:hypothetical protein
LGDARVELIVGARCRLVEIVFLRDFCCRLGAAIVHAPGESAREDAFVEAFLGFLANRGAYLGKDLSASLGRRLTGVVIGACDEEENECSQSKRRLEHWVSRDSISRTNVVQPVLALHGSTDGGSRDRCNP